MRTFIALDLPSDFAVNIAQVESQISASMQAKYVAERSLHLTLAFMGELETASQLSAAQKAIEIAAQNFAPVSLHPDGLGIFGPASDATLFMSVSPTPALMNLAKSVRSELATKGLPFEKTPFKPHVTLARHAHAERFDAKGWAMPGTAHATTVSIYKSELTQQGAVYTPIHSVTL